MRYGDDWDDRTLSIERGCEVAIKAGECGSDASNLLYTFVPLKSLSLPLPLLPSLMRSLQDVHEINA